MNKDEKDSSRETDPIDLVIYAERISRYLEREYIRRSRRRVIGV